MQHLIHPEIILNEFTLAHHRERQDQFHKQQGQGPFSQEMTYKIEAQFRYRHLQEGRRLSSLIPVEIPHIFYGWTAKTANIGAAIRQIP